MESEVVDRRLVSLGRPPMFKALAIFTQPLMPHSSDTLQEVLSVTNLTGDQVFLHPGSIGNLNLYFGGTHHGRN